MNTNLDLSKIQAYSTALSSKLCTSFFAGKEAVNGEQLLSFTPVQQVNLFIVKTLFTNWKAELQKLKSPYFNYEAEEVQTSLNSFMNTLSKNILIPKDNFSPLIQKAITDTIVVCLSPMDYIKEEFSIESDSPKNTLMDKIKYHKVYNTVFTRFQELLSVETQASISPNKVDSIIESLPVATLQEETQSKEILESLNNLLEFDVKEFDTKSIKTSYKQNASQINTPFGEEVKPSAQNPLAQKKVTEKTPLQHQISDQQLTINDSLKSTQEISIAERFSKSKIEDIKSSIPLNLKFLFINILFDGNSVDYNTALNEIEQAESIEKVKDILNKNYAEKYKWAVHAEEKEEFLKIIERKFY